MNTIPVIRPQNADRGSVCAIRPRDFSAEDMVTLPGGRSRHEQPHRWTRPVLNAVVEALAGNTVSVTVDTYTGHTICGVQLIGTSLGRGVSSNHSLVIRDWHSVNCTEPLTLPDGRVRAGCPIGCRGYSDIAHSISDIGEIFPDPQGFVKGAKWIALDILREKNRAIWEAAEAAAR
jgi:hypothetical protein